MDNNQQKQRMSEIQDDLVQHIQRQLKDDDDFMLMATMLLKHSIVLYRTWLEDEEIKNLLNHVTETIDEDYNMDYIAIKPESEGGPTRH